MGVRVWVQALEARRLLSADLEGAVLPEEAVEGETEVLVVDFDMPADDEFTEWEDEDAIEDPEIPDLGEAESGFEDEFTDWEVDPIDEDPVYTEDPELVDEETDTELIDPPIDREWVIDGDMITDGETIIIWCWTARGEIEGTPGGAVARGESAEGDAETESAGGPIVFQQPTELTEETDVSAAGNESATEEFLTEKDSTFDPVDALEAISA